MSIQVEAVVVPSQNQPVKYQAIERPPKGTPIYSLGLAGQPELVGKRVRVTVEVIEDAA